MPATSTILHVAMDAFYASIELRDNPSLAGLPICVGGPSDERGVISAANHDARRFGIEADMPTAEARRRCPDLVLLPPDFERYTAVSREIMGVFGDLHREGMTIIIVTHDSAVAAHCRRVVRLHDGRIVEDRAQAAPVAVAGASA